MSAVNRFLIRLPRLLSKRLWAVPLAGALILGIVGLWVVKRVEETTRGELAARLQTLLQADVNALRLWFTERQYAAKSFASDARVEAAIMQLAALAQDPRATPQSLADSAPAQTLRHYLQPLLEAQEYLGYVVVAPDKRILATTGPEEIGVRAPTAYNLFLNKVLEGQLATSRPFVSQTNLSRRVEGPTMFVAAPIKTTNDVVAAVLGLRMRPEKEFTSIFSVAQIGQTGEAYAFDRSGLMLTATRFDQSLKTLGLIPPGRTNTAILNLKLLDPEGELHPGVPHPKPRSQLHLTRMAASATMGNNDFDVRGYRNYRGLKVIGAWAWLRDCGMGVAAEQSLDEAFQTLYVLRRVFLVLFGLLLASGGAIFGFTLLVEHLQAAGRKDALTARRLGQYVLMQEIGRGANGMVYRARHSLLRRPVAIKLLNPDQTNETNSARFEHEAQMTSQLTHPNTVAIYDYGRTPEGLFYFAMEYLGGIDLDQLVRRFGAQPEGRVIHILRQACGSLAEAHRIGLIHRDVKPANIILTRRGGVCDLVRCSTSGWWRPRIRERRSARRPGISWARRISCRRRRSKNRRAQRSRATFIRWARLAIGCLPARRSLIPTPSRGCSAGRFQARLRPRPSGWASPSRRTWLNFSCAALPSRPRSAPPARRPWIRLWRRARRREPGPGATPNSGGCSTWQTLKPCPPRSCRKRPW